MPVLAPRPEYRWANNWTNKDNIAALIREMDEAVDKYGDPVYDYYSMAHWLMTFLGEN